MTAVRTCCLGRNDCPPIKAAFTVATSSVSNFGHITQLGNTKSIDRYSGFILRRQKFSERNSGAPCTLGVLARVDPSAKLFLVRYVLRNIGAQLLSDTQRG